MVANIKPKSNFTEVSYGVIVNLSDWGLYFPENYLTYNEVKEVLRDVDELRAEKGIV